MSVDSLRLLHDLQIDSEWDNWVGVDTSGDYYQEDESTNTISSANSVFSSFTYSDSDTIFVAGTTGDNSNAGTEAAPVADLSTAEGKLDGSHNQICIMESGKYEGFEINNATIGGSTVRIFTKAEKKVILHRTPSFTVDILISDTAWANVYIYNIYFNGYNLSDGCIIISTDISIKVFYSEAVYGKSDYSLSYESWSGEFINYTTDQTASTVDVYNTLSLSGTFLIVGGTASTNIALEKCYNNIFVFNSSYEYSYFTTLYCDTSSLDIDACVFYNTNLHWIYSDETFDGGTFNQCIFYNTKNFTAVQEATLTFSYCCSNTQLLSGTGNIQGSPQFVKSAPSTAEEFKLKFSDAGFGYDSICYLTGNADGDESIGAWQDSVLPKKAYKKYDLTSRPQAVNIIPTNRQWQVYEDEIGYTDPVKSKTTNEVTIIHSGYVSNEDLGFYKKIFGDAYELTDSIDTLREELAIKMFRDIDNALDTGTVSDIDLSDKEITVSENYYWQEFKGYNIWLKWETMTSSSVTVSGSAITVNGFSGMTADEYIGYWVCIYNSSTTRMIYYIYDNDTTSVTAYDPNGYVSDGTYDAFIYYPFKITRNTNDTNSIITVDDPDDKLESTPTTYEIQEIDLITDSNQCSFSRPQGYIPARDRERDNDKYVYTNVKMTLREAETHA